MNNDENKSIFCTSDSKGVLNRNGDVVVIKMQMASCHQICKQQRRAVLFQRQINWTIQKLKSA